MKEPDYKVEAYYAMKSVNYQRRVAMAQIEVACNEPSLSPEERLDKISNILEISGMKARDIQTDSAN